MKEIRLAAIFSVLALGACQGGYPPADVQNGANTVESKNNSTVAPPAAEPSAPPALSAPPPPLALTTAEQQGLIDQLRQELSQKRYPDNRASLSPCSNIYSIGAGEVTDNMISGATGRVQITFNIVALSSFDVGGHCYGVNLGRQWAEGEAVRVSFDRDIERWSSGWRLQPQRLSL